MRDDGSGTKFVTLIGAPLAQSYAARMQNAAYRAAGIDLRYFYTEAGTERLREILEGIRCMPGFAGAAITKPNKVAVMDLLDELDPLCREVGACNTVVREPDGRLVGYNTDAIGFRESFVERSGVPIMGQSFFVMGAGGAGRPICSVLAHCGAARIFVVDPYEQAAAQLACEVNARFGDVVRCAAFGDFAQVSECSAVINASGVGMGASAGVSPLPPEYLHAGQFCFDACYNPARTQFLLDAEAAGCAVLNGLDMSLYQGAAQVHLWAGAEPSLVLGAMRAELLAILQDSQRAEGEAC